MKATELKKKKNMVNIKDLKVGDKVTVHLCEGDFVDEVVCVKPQFSGANKYIVELKECGIIFNEDFLDFIKQPSGKTKRNNMNKYIGIKVVKAEPMTMTEAQKVLGRELKPATVEEDGYLVEYKDGYKSWSPASVFNEAYHKFGTMLFGEAVEALKSGLAIRRAGWNGKGLFVIKQVPAHITSGIIPNMQSLPQSAKDLLMKRENPHIDYTNQMLIVNPDGRADSWVPSVSDVFAEDWEIVTD